MTKKTAGRPAIIFRCETCKLVMSKKAVRSHKFSK